MSSSFDVYAKEILTFLPRSFCSFLQDQNMMRQTEQSDTTETNIQQWESFSRLIRSFSLRVLLFHYFEYLSPKRLTNDSRRKTKGNHFSPTPFVKTVKQSRKSTKTLGVTFVPHYTGVLLLLLHLLRAFNLRRLSLSLSSAISFLQPILIFLSSLLLSLFFELLLRPLLPSFLDE